MMLESLGAGLVAFGRQTSFSLSSCHPTHDLDYFVPLGRSYQPLASDMQFPEPPGVCVYIYHRYELIPECELSEVLEHDISPLIS